MTDTPDHPSAPAADVPVDASDRTLPRLVRNTLPLALDVGDEVAKLNGVCIRPVALRRLDTHTGQSETVRRPVRGHPGGQVPAVRQAQPATPDGPMPRRLAPGGRTDRQPRSSRPKNSGGWSSSAPMCRPSAMRPNATAKTPPTWTRRSRASTTRSTRPGCAATSWAAGPLAKRSRSTRRRQDAPDLPKRARQDTTLGRTFTGSGRQGLSAVAVRHPHPALLRPDPLRPGVPVDPTPTTTRAAARDALHFSKLVDRFVQNLRRVAGYDVQYFATVEPQKRLAPHLHMAIRGHPAPRGDQGRSPRRPTTRCGGRRSTRSASTVTTCRSGPSGPTWRRGAYPDGQSGDYLDPATGELLPTWDEALDQLDADEDAEPLHVAALRCAGRRSGRPRRAPGR